MSRTATLNPEAARAQRALESYPDYRFRLIDWHGQAVAEVTSPAGQVYHVSGDRCDCPDYQQRGRYTGVACKHVGLAALWLDEQSEPNAWDVTPILGPLGLEVVCPCGCEQRLRLRLAGSR